MVAGENGPARNQVTWLPAYFGIMCLGLGQVEQALDWYEKAIEDRDAIVLYLSTEPKLGRIRSHPRYQAPRRKMLLPD
ncbi:MAG: hypothetical protein WBW31_03050 [Candidatus Sulfotelmatobacter sp.]